MECKDTCIWNEYSPQESITKHDLDNLSVTAFVATLQAVISLLEQLTEKGI